MDGLSQAFASLRSAVTPQERLQEADWVRRARREDLDRAERLVDQTDSYLVAAGLDAPAVRLEK